MTNLALENGQVVSGLLLREEGEVLIVADAQGKEVRVPKKTVEERSTAQLSPMPANMAEQIPEAEFQDLMAYILSHREDTKPAESRAEVSVHGEMRSSLEQRGSRPASRGSSCLTPQLRPAAMIVFQPAITGMT